MMSNLGKVSPTISMNLRSTDHAINHLMEPLAWPSPLDPVLLKTAKPWRVSLPRTEWYPPSFLWSKPVSHWQRMESSLTPLSFLLSKNAWSRKESPRSQKPAWCAPSTPKGKHQMGQWRAPHQRESQKLHACQPTNPRQDFSRSTITNQRWEISGFCVSCWWTEPWSLLNTLEMRVKPSTASATMMRREHAGKQAVKKRKNSDV